jgi:cyanate permease
MDKMAARYALMLGFCCYLLGVGLALRVSAHSLVVAYAAAILFGLGFGWTFIAVYTVVGHFYGSAAYPKLSGMMALISSVTAAPSSAIGGKLFDTYGSYTPAFELIGLVTLVAMVTLVFATMPQRETSLPAHPAI